MKERLDQLRAMDSAAFMALPASSFSPIPKESVPDPEELAMASSPYTNLNGYLPHAEGERRRKEMLEVATMLEERYRVLLPPDRVRRAPEPSESASRSQVQSRDGNDSETDHTSVIGEKLRLRLPARSSTSTTPAPSPAAIKPTIKKPRPSGSSKQSSVIRILRPIVLTPSPPSPSPSRSHGEGSPLSPSPSPTIDMDISSPESTPPPPSPIPRVPIVLHQIPIHNQASLVAPRIRPDVPLSNHGAKAIGIMSEQQNSTFSEHQRAFAPLEQETPVTPSDQETPVTPPDQEMLVTPPDQETLITPNEQERLPALPDQERPTIPEPEKSPTPYQERPIHDQESLHDQELLHTLPEQERLSTPELERRSTSPKPENLNTLDQERVPSPPSPDRLRTTPEREKSITPTYRRSLTPLVQDQSVTLDREKSAPPLEQERPVTPEPLSPPPEQERLTMVEPEKLPTPTPPVPERLTTPLADVTDQDLRDSLPEDESSHRASIGPPMTDVEESEEVGAGEMSVWAESEVPAPQNEPEPEPEPEKEEVDIESEADKMDVEQDETVRLGPAVTEPAVVVTEPAVVTTEPAVVVTEPAVVATEPTVVVTGPAVIADATMDAIPDTDQTVLADVPMTKASASSGPTVVEQTHVSVSEVGLNLGRPVTPEQRPRTESVDIEEQMPFPTTILSISAPRSRARKRARLDSSLQSNEVASAPVRALRVPKNHVTYIGASGEVEVTASAIIKAAVHRTQRDATRHLNAFGVLVPNAIIQMGPPFELPEWVFPPLSPAESEHAHGDFDSIEDFELNPKVPSEQVTPSLQARPVIAIETEHKASMKVNSSTVEKEPVAADYTPSIEVDPVGPIVQPTRQSGPKNKTPLPPPPEACEEDTVSLGDDDI